MSGIFLNDEELRKRLQLVASRLQNPLELTSTLERVLVSQTLQNFHANGRPAWAGLSPVTLEIYRKQGITPQGILQRSPAGLKASIQGDHDRDSATVMAGSGQSKNYAAIHQFGGKTSAHKIVPKKKKALAFGGIVRKSVNHPGSTIPARPFLPIDESGNLQNGAEESILDIALIALQKGL